MGDAVRMRDGDVNVDRSREMSARNAAWSDDQTSFLTAATVKIVVWFGVTIAVYV